MLRITKLQDAFRTGLKLEGKLAGEWVSEVEKAWVELKEFRLQENLTVDLRGLSFVDDRGCELLRRMHHTGADFIGSGPMIGGLIEDITGDRCAEVVSGKWVRGLFGLLFLLLFLTVTFA